MPNDPVTPITWDETLTVGDLITAYHAGYHILTRFHFRDHLPPIIDYVRVVNKRGEGIAKTKQKERSCCASYARRVDRERIEQLRQAELQAAETKRTNLLDFATR